MKSPITQTLLEEAIQAFYVRIAEAFPEATSGDVPPDVAIRFEYAAREAAEDWVKGNVPPVMPLHNVDGIICRGSVTPGYVQVLDNGRWHCNRCGFTCTVEN